MQREDPSVQVAVDTETGQTLLKGMGELHLDTVRHRLVHDFKIEAELGKMRVSYRETVSDAAENTFVYSNAALVAASGGKPAWASLTISIEPDEGLAGKNVVELAAPPLPSPAGPVPMPKEFVAAVEAGLRDSLSRGAVLGYTVINTRVRVIGWNQNADSTANAFRTCAARCLLAAMREAGPTLLEPIMHADIEFDTEYTNGVLSELSGRRRAMIQSSTPAHNKTVVLADVPLAEMIGYASHLRSTTQGTGSFTMELARYSHVPPALQANLVANPP